jgi:predicted Zn-dependent protease
MPVRPRDALANALEPASALMPKRWRRLALAGAALLLLTVGFRPLAGMLALNLATVELAKAGAGAGPWERYFGSSPAGEPRVAEDHLARSAAWRAQAQALLGGASPTLARQEAWAALLAGDLATHERLLDDLVRDVPDDDLARETRGWLRLSRGDVEGALDDLGGMRAASALWQLAVWLKGRAPAAERAGDATAAQRARGHLQTVIAAVSALASAGRAVEAGAGDGSAEDLYTLGLLVLEYRPDDVAVAERFFQRAVDLAPRDPRFLYHAGLMAGRRGDYERAQRYLEQVIACCPRTSLGPAAHFLLGFFALQRGAFATAARELEQATAQQPTAHWFAYLAQAYRALGDQAAAEQAARRAQELGNAP